MRAKALVKLRVAALPHEIFIEFAEDGAEAVGIVDLPAVVAGRHAEPVGEPVLAVRHDAGEEPVRMDALELLDRGVAVAVEDGYLAGLRREDVDDQGFVAAALHAENDEGIAVAAAYDGVDVRRRRGIGICACRVHEAAPLLSLTRSSSPRRGMSTQVGRFASS